MRYQLSAALALTVVLMGCHRQMPPQQSGQWNGPQPYQQNGCAQSRDPQECDQWVGHGGNINDYLTGGAGGYMLARMMNPNTGQYQQVYMPDPNYHGAPRHLHSSFGTPYNQMVYAQRAQIQRQKAELGRQQEANRRKNEQIKQMKIDHAQQLQAARSTGMTKKSWFGGNRSTTASGYPGGTSTSYAPGVSSTGYRPSYRPSSSYTPSRTYTSSPSRSYSYHK